MQDIQGLLRTVSQSGASDGVCGQPRKGYNKIGVTKSKEDNATFPQHYRSYTRHINRELRNHVQISREGLGCIVIISTEPRSRKFMAKIVV